MNIKEKGLPFIIAASFLISLISIRLLVLIAGSADSEFAQAAKAGSLPGTNFYIGSNIILFGYHIHHFYFGVLLIAIAGWLSITEKPKVKKSTIAILYGVGLGLFLDEIGLLLTWGDYFSGLTYIISLFILAIFFNMIFFADFWKSVRNQIKNKPNPIKSLFGSDKAFFKTLDRLTKTTFLPKKISAIFSSAIYIGMAVFVLIEPAFVKYILGGGFIIEGMLIIAKTIYQKEAKNEED